MPFVNTRPKEHPHWGHYWFEVPLDPKGVRYHIGNRSFPRAGFDLRCLGGGIVLPPYGDRYVVRSGRFPVLPDELLAAFIAGAGVVGGEYTLGDFVDKYAVVDPKRSESKLKGLRGLHAKLLRDNNPHNAMREALKVGLGEAKVGYVSAVDVIETLSGLWDRDLPEFRRLCKWAACVVESTDSRALKAKSNRLAGSDSRNYFGYFAK